jgi:GNAT superfamily N-acetyltransferase
VQEARTGRGANIVPAGPQMWYAGAWSRAAMRHRVARQSDVPVMARIRGTDLHTEDAWTARISAYLAGEHHPQHALLPRVSYVALDDDAVVGYVAGHLSRRYGCAGELQWMNVIPEQRGTGVAGKLLRLLAKWFVKQKALRICVNVDPANAAARRFYAKHGAERLNDQWLMWNDIRTVLRNQQTRATSAI